MFDTFKKERAFAEYELFKSLTSNYLLLRLWYIITHCYSTLILWEGVTVHIAHSTKLCPNCKVLNIALHCQLVCARLCLAGAWPSGCWVVPCENEPVSCKEFSQADLDPSDAKTVQSCAKLPEQTLYYKVAKLSKSETGEQTQWKRKQFSILVQYIVLLQWLS